MPSALESFQPAYSRREFLTMAAAGTTALLWRSQFASVLAADADDDRAACLNRTRDFVQQDEQLHDWFVATSKRLQAGFRQVNGQINTNPTFLGEGTEEELQARQQNVGPKLAELSENVEPHVLALLAAWKVDHYPAVRDRVIQPLDVQVSCMRPEYYQKYKGKISANSRKNLKKLGDGMSRITGFTLELGPPALSSGERLEYETMHELQHILVQNIAFLENTDRQPTRPKKYHLGVLDERYPNVFGPSRQIDHEVVKEGLAELKNQQALHLLGKESKFMTYLWQQAVAIQLLACDEEATTRWFTGDYNNDQYYDAMDVSLKKLGVTDARQRLVLMNLALQDNPTGGKDGYYESLEKVTWTWIETLAKAGALDKNNLLAFWNRAGLPPRVRKQFFNQ